MAVTKSPQSTEEKLILEIDNGDLEAINDVISKYDFSGEEGLFRFALNVLLRAENQGVYIKENGQITFLQPAEKVLQKKEE